MGCLFVAAADGGEGEDIESPLSDSVSRAPVMRRLHLQLRASATATTPCDVVFGDGGANMSLILVFKAVQMTGVTPRGRRYANLSRAQPLARSLQPAAAAGPSSSSSCLPSPQHFKSCLRDPLSGISCVLHSAPAYAGGVGAVRRRARRTTAELQAEAEQLEGMIGGVRKQLQVTRSRPIHSQPGLALVLAPLLNISREMRRSDAGLPRQALPL